MSSNVRANRWSQIVAWSFASLFAAGFFLPAVGAWTSPVTGAWFVGTQKPRRGFLWMMAFSFIPSLLFDWRRFPLTSPAQIPEYVGRILLVALLSVLPFTFHRLVSPRLHGVFSTLTLPLAGVVIANLLQPLLHIGTAPAETLHTFISLWLAAVLVWMWNLEFRASKIALGSVLFGTVFVLVACIELFSHFGGGALPKTMPIGAIFAWISLAGTVVLSLWALFNPGKHNFWAKRSESVARLQSPFTKSPLHVVSEKGREALAGASGERFEICNEIPVFLRPEDLTGDNGKYNHLYETIGGFYDDIQRVACAIRGLELESYFRAYMDLLKVKPGDSVLETSVGTGLNFKYLPRGVKLTGLDLSAEMLANCQNNLRRWEMDADLILGNAESLPFADSSFDVVYTCGGFNFFSDGAKAVREMIRVTKPGGHLMIEDETEEYVKSTYENIPYTSGLYKDRQKAVTVPIDLVPPEMENIHAEMLKDGKFYAITFRKPEPGVQHGDSIDRM